MDPAIYTLIGALGGVLLTQSANYFLEKRRSDSQIILKKMELNNQQHHDLLRARREAFSKYLSNLDYYLSGKIPDLAELMPYFYGAIILSSESTSKAILHTFILAKKKLPGDEESNKLILNAKEKALIEMMNDLQSNIDIKAT